ncbi:MAG: type II secretion system protein GspG [Acidobacteriota bacterium]|jgi:hypothetical protein|nr:type II secretion system protein GspG [Acidobacteriota bacterium]
MRFRFLIVFLLLPLLLSACGGRKMNGGLARNLIVGAQSDAMRKSDVDVTSVQQVSATEAIAETRVRTAFRFEKDGSVWRIREIRLGHGQWERIENIEQALDQIKTEETGAMLDKLAAAVRKYREANQRLPSIKDFIDLTDQLTPAYLTPLVRLDAWQRPFEATSGTFGIILRSAGPDGLAGTKDDISVSITGTK